MKELSLHTCLACELVGLFHQLTLLRKIRKFTLSQALAYFYNHETVDNELLTHIYQILNNDSEFSREMLTKPLTYLKGFSVPTLQTLIEIFHGCISSLEYVYEID